MTDRSRDDVLKLIKSDLNIEGQLNLRERDGSCVRNAVSPAVAPSAAEKILRWRPDQALNVDSMPPILNDAWRVRLGKSKTPRCGSQIDAQLMMFAERRHKADQSGATDFF